MPRRLESLKALVVFCAFAPATSVAEEVEHPIYRSWARHPIGTSVTLRQVTTTGTRTIVTSTKTTLVELNAEGAVLEVRMTSDGTGTVVESPPQTYLQRRMFPLFGKTTKDDVGKPPKGSKSGEETLEVAGRRIKTVWFDSDGRTDAGSSNTRTWMSDDVPGKTVKALTRVVDANNKTTAELVEFTVPGKGEAPAPATAK